MNYSAEMKVAAISVKFLFFLLASMILGATLYVFYEEGLECIQHGNDMKEISGSGSGSNWKIAKNTNLLKRLKEEEEIYADLVRSSNKNPVLLPCRKVTTKWEKHTNSIF